MVIVILQVLLVIYEEIDFLLLASILIHAVSHEMSISSTNLLPNSSEIVFDDVNAGTYLISIITHISSTNSI